MHDPMAEAIKKKRNGLTISIDVDHEGGMKASQKGSELAPEAPELDEDPADLSDLSPPDVSKESPEYKASLKGQVPEKAMIDQENDEGKDLSMFDDIAKDQAMSGRPPKSLTERAAAMHAAKKPQKY